ncbi:MAG: hypothetical protein IKR13_05495 [Victivallales bacterium]|nr:hypothetical protein [Victivallales bacterium]
MKSFEGRKIGACVMLMGLALLVASCASTAHFDYRRAPGTMQRFRLPISHETVCVESFRDFRMPVPAEGASQLALERGSFALGWLPLMPYAWVRKACPEVPGGHNFATLRSYWCQFDVELAGATVTSLNYSHLFSTPCVLASPGIAETDWIFRGTLYDSSYEGERLTYGVTYLLAPALWAIGFPTGVSHNRLSVGFELINRRTGKVAWQFHYSGKANTVHWLYWNVGKDASRYPQLMRTALNAALYDLSQNFPQLEVP